MLDQCNQEIFTKGKPLLLADTYECSAAGFEVWIQNLAKQSGQKIDWHYSGGIAQVLFIGDRDKIFETMKTIKCPAIIMRIIESGEGLYRQGITETPDNVIAGFYAGGDETTFIQSQIKKSN